jgi:hypothetical protein
VPQNSSIAGDEPVTTREDEPPPDDTAPLDEPPDEPPDATAVVTVLDDVLDDFTVELVVELVDEVELVDDELLELCATDVEVVLELVDVGGALAAVHLMPEGVSVGSTTKVICAVQYLSSWVALGTPFVHAMPTV